MIAVTQLLKKHGALSCWDYATAVAHDAPVMTSIDVLCFLESYFGFQREWRVYVIAE
jgi:hypothetical protein